MSESGDSDGVSTIRLVLLDAVQVVVVVAFVATVLFAVTGVWPPMVAVESESMAPEMTRGDLIIVVEEHRYVGDAAHEETGVVTTRAGSNVSHESFGSPGDVIIYRPNGRSDATPIIHRARFWVDSGENWYEKADDRHLKAESCAELRLCPAPNAGFVTLGDNNQYYDQSNQMMLSKPVRPEWVVGKAKARVPYLGYPRLVIQAASD